MDNHQFKTYPPQIIKIQAFMFNTLMCEVMKQNNSLGFQKMYIYLSTSISLLYCLVYVFIVFFLLYSFFAFFFNVSGTLPNGLELWFITFLLSRVFCCDYTTIYSFIQMLTNIWVVSNFGSCKCWCYEYSYACFLDYMCTRFSRVYSWKLNY